MVSSNVRLVKLIRGRICEVFVPEYLYEIQRNFGFVHFILKLKKKKMYEYYYYKLRIVPIPFYITRIFYIDTISDSVKRKIYDV